MAKHIAGMLNPWQTGLLSGIANLGSTLDKFNMIRMQNEGRIAAYQAKYGAMQQTNALRAQNTAMMKQLQLEANQRAYKTQETGQDGKVYNVSYRNTFNPETGQFEPKEIGRAVAPPDAGELLDRRLSAADARQQAAIGAQDARQAAREKAIQDRLDERDKNARERDEQKEQAAKLDKLDGKVEKDMDKFDNADPQERATLLKSVGISPTVSKTEPGLLYGTNTKDVPNPDARDAYEKAITAKHAKQMGIKAPGDSGSVAPSGGPPAMTVNGQPVRMGPNGPYTTDKDGNKIPVTKDANGNLVGAPLAMDDQSSASPTAMPDESGSSENDQDEQESGSPLLADNDNGGGGANESDEEEPGSQASDQEDEEDDAAQDQQSQALLA